MMNHKIKYVKMKKIFLMSNPLIETIVSEDVSVRNRSIDLLLKQIDNDNLLKIAGELEEFRRSSNNLYHKVRACLFLYIIYRFYLPSNCNLIQGTIPLKGIEAAFNRDFERALDIYFSSEDLNIAICSAIADSYYRLSFMYLRDQVKLSISQCRENKHLYKIKGPEDYPFKVSKLYLKKISDNYPVGMDACPVRLDPSHSGWSDIFFLGMDFPEGARVINISVNLRINGSNDPLIPPCECYCRVIDEPVIYLRSIDLRTSKKIYDLNDLFDFGSDDLSLLKAGVVASGIIPPVFEGKDIPLREILKRLLGREGGIEIVTRVNNIPKCSRLAVSTTLLATIITRLMRFSGQIKTQTGGLTDEDRRIIASRAILGEWLGGSGGGWQDSGGLWPGIKVIKGRLASEGDPEYGISRGCLLPEHHVFKKSDLPPDLYRLIHESMVLVHGGISQDVGPILEMVTEKYLLRHEKEWGARLRGIELFDQIVDAIIHGDMRELGRLTTTDWEEAIQNVIPWVNNAYTEELINSVKKSFGSDYWGFLMLGGMSGGGMAFIVNPERNSEFKEQILQIMMDLKNKYKASYPFIIDPVVYDFEINNEGIMAHIMQGSNAIVPEIDGSKEGEFIIQSESEEGIKRKYGFDRRSHEYMKKLLKQGEISLEKNRLPVDTIIEDVSYGDLLHYEDEKTDSLFIEAGIEALRNNQVAVVTLAGGMGSRWTHGSAVIKAINPFVKMHGRFRTFLDIHIAKSKMTCKRYSCTIPHIITTSYLTHEAIERYLKEFEHFGYSEHLYLSPSKSIGRRVYPMIRDLLFHFQEELRQKEDEQKQKILESSQRAIIEWVKEKGEGEDFMEADPLLRFNPPGHWYEVPNLFKNGILSRILRNHPEVKYLMCHNIDTLGAWLDPAVLGMHIMTRACITFEVTPRMIEDTGGGLAKINGKIRLIEGMALPDEAIQYRLSYYNTLTNWIDIDKLLGYFGLDRSSLINNGDNNTRIAEAIHNVEKKIPTYVTLKQVKHIWGKGHEYIYLVAQFEKLWGDMAGLDDIDVSFVSVSRYRGQQLKEPALLDQWFNDGSFDYVSERCDFD